MRKVMWGIVAVWMAVLVAAPAFGQTIKVGDIGSKTGVFEGYGRFQSYAVGMAVEEINAKGGVLGKKLEVVVEDDQTNPKEAVRKTEKLILQDKVNLIVGAVSSGATLAMMDTVKKYAQQYNVIHWNAISCAEFMRTKNFHPYYFNNQPDSRYQANGLAGYILKNMGKRVYIFYTDYAMGQSDGRQFKVAMEKLGGEIVGIAGAPLDTKDFTPWFGQIEATKPEVLFLAFAGNDSLRLMQQLHQFGMTKKYKLAGIDCFLLQQDLPQIAEPMEGFIQMNHFSPYNPDPAMQAYNKKFRAYTKKVTGKELDGNISMGAYDGVYFWANAVSKAGTLEADKVVKAMEGSCIENGKQGKACIRPEDHQVMYDIDIYKISKGKNEPIARLKAADIAGEPMVGKDPLPGFTWEIKKK
jgi:branched-chain amino acid transport system substrate-binding protein